MWAGLQILPSSSFMSAPAEEAEPIYDSYFVLLLGGVCNSAKRPEVILENRLKMGLVLMMG